MNTDSTSNNIDIDATPPTTITLPVNWHNIDIDNTPPITTILPVNWLRICLLAIVLFLVGLVTVYDTVMAIFNSTVRL